MIEYHKAGGERTSATNYDDEGRGGGGRMKRDYSAHPRRLKGVECVSRKWLAAFSLT